MIVVGADDKKFGLRPDGSLRDISPTLLAILGAPRPHEMTGTDLRVSLENSKLQL